MRAVYISPNTADAATAQTLGLGFIYDPTSSAHALIQGAGQTVTLPAPVTAAQVTAAETPIQTAEAAQAATQANEQANAATLQQRAATALTNNAAYLAIGSPTQAQAVAQVGALTRQVDGLIRFLLQSFDTITDS